MKLLKLLLLTLVLTGCAVQESKPEEKFRDSYNDRNAPIISTPTEPKMETAIINKHRYLLFTAYNGYGNIVVPVHDPDCDLCLVRKQPSK